MTEYTSGLPSYGTNYFWGFLRILENLSDQDLNVFRTLITDSNEIDANTESGKILRIVMVAIRHNCMLFGYESHENGGYYDNDTKFLAKFSKFYDDVILQIANLLKINTSLGMPHEKFIDSSSYWVRELPNNYISSDPQFITKLLSAKNDSDIESLSKTITLQKN